MPRWWPRGGRRQRPLPRWRRPASGTRLPNPLEDVRAEAPPRSQSGPERRVAAAGLRHRLGGAAAASAPVRSWQALSPVGAQKLPPETLKQHSTTFPRVSKIIVCAAQGRRPGHGVAQAPRTRRVGAGGWGGDLLRGHRRPSPSPRGLAMCFPRTEVEARNGNSWREFNADILKLRVFCFIWRGWGPINGKGWARHGVQCSKSQDWRRGLRRLWEAGPGAGGRRGQEFGAEGVLCKQLTISPAVCF